MSTTPGPAVPRGAPGASDGPEVEYRAVRPSTGRARWVLVLMLLSGLVALTALPVWITATGASPLADEVDLTVRGSGAAPGVVAAALVLLAAAAALALVGRVGRWVVVVVVAAAGALVVVAALGGRSGATGIAERAAAEATGVSRLVGEPQVAVWPWLTLALGVLVLLAAVGLARASGRWAAPSSRHERTVPVGTTPTTGSAPSAGASTARPDGAGDPATAPDGAVDERSAWDALTRGDDPS